GSGCTSVIEVRNLGEVADAIDLEGHRGNGALVGFAGHAFGPVRLPPGARDRYRLDIPENETDTHAWVLMRERSAHPSVALSGSTECREGDGVRTLAREAAYATRNPRFAGDVGDMRGSMLAVINLSLRPAVLQVCYSAGNLYSVPGETQESRELQPVCSSWRDEQVPPFGTRNLPVQREDSAHLSVKTRGDSVLLQMLHPAPSNLRTYTVDSTIRFGAEVPAK
ncbi:MAG: hypothetical protein ABI806_29555, partial [Candidatus Solibacter sp.]